jgi:hypothetical protein
MKEFYVVKFSIGTMQYEYLAKLTTEEYAEIVKLLQKHADSFEVVQGIDEEVMEATHLKKAIESILT